MALSAAVFQKESGILRFKEIEFGVRNKDYRYSKREAHFSGVIPSEYRNDLVAELGIVCEDGQPLPFAASSMKRVNRGYGRYRLSQKHAHFATLDNSDPNTNGRQYTLRVPQRVRMRVIWILYGCLLISAFLALRPPTETDDPGMPASPASLKTHRYSAEAIVAFSISLLAGAWFLVNNAGFSDGGLCVLGKPYSDALGWHEFAIYLKEGLGFTSAYSSSRPFYPIFQAMVFLFAGDTVTVAQWTNVLLLAVTGTFAYLTARCLFSRTVGFGVLAFVLLAPSHQTMIPRLLTELPGLAFGAVGVFLFSCACLGERRRGLLFFLAGVFLGLSNLARPFTLLALPLCFVVVLYLSKVQSWGWRSSIGRYALLGCGALVVIFPWSLRQKLVVGTWSISANSSEVLYGAAMPGEEKWNAKEFSEAEASGIDTSDTIARIAFFSKRYKETVAEDPIRYLEKVGAKSLAFFGHFSIDAHILRGIVTVSMLAGLLQICAVGRSVAPLAGLPVLWAALTLGRVEEWPWIVVVGLAAGLVILTGGTKARTGVLIILVFLAGSGLLSGLVGNFAIWRGLSLVHWMFVMLVVAAAVSLARVIGTFILRMLARGKGQPTSSQLGPPAGEPWRAAPMWMVFGLCAFLAIGAAALCIRAISVDPDGPSIVRMDSAQRERIIDSVFNGLPGGGAVDRSLVFCEPVIINHYRWEISKDIDVGHWSRMFERRSYARTVAYLELGDAYPFTRGRIAGQFRGDLTQITRKILYVVVGLKNIDLEAPLGDEIVMVESMALIPYDTRQGGALLDEIVRYPLTPEAKNLLGNPLQ